MCQIPHEIEKKQQKKFEEQKINDTFAKRFAVLGPLQGDGGCQSLPVWGVCRPRWSGDRNLKYNLKTDGHGSLSS